MVDVVFVLRLGSEHLAGIVGQRLTADLDFTAVALAEQQPRGVF